MRLRRQNRNLWKSVGTKLSTQMANTQRYGQLLVCIGMERRVILLLAAAQHFPLIRLAASSTRFEFILVLEKPYFGLDHPDYVRYCQTTK